MPESKPTMTKLATGRNLFALFVANRQTLWLAGDHLLLLSSTGYTERVRRFYFADIQSIVYARNNAGAVVSILCVALALLLAALGYMIAPLGDISFVGVFMAVLVTLPLFGLGFNLLAGPTCACVISTAVQTERVLALNRIAKAERVIGEILPLLDAAQGRLSPEMLAVDQPEAAAVEAGQHALEGGAGRVELRHEPGNFHRASYVLCLVSAASHAADIFLESGVKNVLDALLLAALMIVTLVAFRRQANSDLPGTVKNLSPVILALIVASFFASIYLGVYFLIMNPEHAFTRSGQIIMPRDSVVTQVFLLCCTIAFALSGVMGLMRLGRVRTPFPAAEKEFVARPGARDDAL